MSLSVENLVKKLSFEWFKKKNEFFLREGLYNPDLGRIHNSFLERDDVKGGEEETRIITVDVDLNRYCWSCIFYGSDAARQFDDETLFNSNYYPIDSHDISTDIVTLIHKSTEKFIDIEAIDVFIKNVAQEAAQTIDRLKTTSTDSNYINALSDFLVKLREVLNDEFSHIKRQIKLKRSQNGVDRKLTVQICSRLANFRLNNKLFITNVDGPLDKANALLYLLSPTKDRLPNVKIWVEDWAKRDVYYLLSKLQDVVSPRFSMASIDGKNALRLKDNGLFDQGNYKKFKSADLPKYEAKNPNKAVIDDFFKTLF